MGWPCFCGFRARTWFACVWSLAVCFSGLSFLLIWLVFLVLIFWFSGLFSKHRSRINTILEPLRSYLRYGRNGPCFVRFRDRLVTQTCQNVEKYRRDGLSGTLQGVPCSGWGSAMGWTSPCVCGARPWPTHMAELPCWGARGSATRRRFALLGALPFVFGAFLEAPKSYRGDS